MIAVCPKCLEPKVMGHVCGSPPQPRRTAAPATTVKQAAISVQATKRRKYEHEGIELEHITLFVTFDIDAVGKFDPLWLLDFIKNRMDIPEGPEDYPNVEDFYIKDARLG